MLLGGLDECGWGCLAGPIISVVAVFRKEDIALMPPGVRDSKKVPPKRRDALFLPLCASAVDVGIGHAWPWEIDELTPGVALQLSYTRAIEELAIKPDVLYMDGNRPVKSWRGSQKVEPKSDVLYPHVSAASIIAKSFRDKMMRQLSYHHPKYGWDTNSGYGTEDHKQAILRHGLILGGAHRLETYAHRRSYCKKFLY